MQQEELVVQKEELGRLAISNQQDLVDIVDADSFKDKEAIKALLAV